MSMSPPRLTLGYTTIVIIMMTVYRYKDCHNVTYTNQTEVVDSNISLSLQTPAVNFTVENETVSMLQCAMYNDMYTYLSKCRLQLTLASL